MPIAQQDLSAEEFTRIQGELVALKIQNHDLMEELRRLETQEGVPSTPSTATSASSAFKFATGMKMSSSAMTAFRSKGGTSRRHTGDGVHSDEQDEAESLRVQVESLRARLESSTRELKEAREAAAKAEGELLSASTSDESPGENVDKLRRLIFELEDAAIVRGEGDDSHAELIGFVSDALLVRIAAAACELHAKAKEMDTASKLGSHAPGRAGGPDDHVQQLLKIQRQQKDLEKLREMVDKQQTEITRLTGTIADSRLQAARESANLPANKKPMEERLFDAQKKVDELETKLNATSDISRHTYELKCQLQSIEDKVHHRDQAIEKMRPQQEKQTTLYDILQERVRFSAEDLRASLALEFELRTLADLPAVLQKEDPAGSVVMSSTEPTDLGELDERFSLHNGFITNGDDLGRQTMTVSAAKLKALQIPGCKGFCFRGAATNSVVDVFFKSKWDNMADVNQTWTSYKLEADPALCKPEVFDVGVQSDSICGDESPASGTNKSSPSHEVEMLREALEDLKADKKSIEQQGLRELQELRAQVRKQQHEELNAVAQVAMECKSNDSVGGRPSPEKEEYAVVDVPNTSGMLYVQKIAELEQLNTSLGCDLELLQETEQCLLQDSREKDDLIIFLIQKEKLAELERDSSLKKQAGMKRASDAALSVVGNLFWGQGRRDVPAAAIDELEHEAEEAIRDNVRLRNDLRFLGEEYKKAVAARSSSDGQLHSNMKPGGADVQQGGKGSNVRSADDDEEEF